MDYALLHHNNHNNHDAAAADGLWDELSDQQTREIQQHHAQHAQQNHHDYSRSEAWTHNPRLALVRRIVQQTRDEAIRYGQVVYDAARDAWREHEDRQLRGLYSFATTATSHRMAIDQHHHHADNTYLRDFGIAVDGHEYAPLNSNSNQQQQQANDNDFIFLPQLTSNPQYGAVANLDMFFGSLYAYYYHRGLVPIVTKGIVQLISLLFTLVLSVFLCVYVDWSALVTCVDEATCQAHLTEYLHQDPFWNYTSLWRLILILIYIGLFLLYAAFATWSCLHSVLQALTAKFVFEERLGISARKLQGGAVDWNLHVVDKLLELQQSGEYRVAIHGQDLDALVIANRILRKENFMVALFNRGLLNLKVPLLGNHTFFCSSLEWSLYFCIVNFMFNHKYQIRPAFYLDHGALRRRFIVCGIIHLIFLPFLLFFTTLHFGLQNAYDWKSTKKYLGPREWSLSSKWLFREFNELQHHFESRLYPSYEAAENYLALFGQSEIVAACGRILVFIGGSLGAVLFVLAAINDAILLHVRIADWNLLWYAGMVGVVYSVGKAMIPSEEIRPRRIRNLYAETDAALTGIANHTHYYMPHWKGRAHDEVTYKTIKSMFQFKAQLFVMEMASLLLTPYILCISLAQGAEAICEFIFLTKSNIAGAGEVCGYATFDFDRFEDEAWEGRTMAIPASREIQLHSLSESVLRTRNTEEARRLMPVHKARLGKMEKSFFSFKAMHPTWKCPPSGQFLVDRIEKYKREESAAMAREQDLHIEAAARQLETLTKLNQRQQLAKSVCLDHDHIPRTRVSANFDTGSYTGSVVSATTSAESLKSSFDHIHGQMLRNETSSDDLLPFATLPKALHTSAPETHQGNCLTMTAHGLTSMRDAGNRLSSATGMSMSLSSELRRILNLSTLDPEVSLLAGNSTEEDYDRRTERQYLWLERYHQHVAAQQQGEGNDSVSGARNSHSSMV